MDIRTTIETSLLRAAALAVVAWPATAQDQAKEAQEFVRAHPKLRAEVNALADADRNGKLDAAERTTARKIVAERFARWRAARQAEKTKRAQAEKAGSDRKQRAEEPEWWKEHLEQVRKRRAEQARKRSAEAGEPKATVDRR